MEFIDTLKERNTLLFWFGFLCLVAATFLFLLSVAKPVGFQGTNAWYKPIKFSLSTAFLVLALGWYTGYMPDSKDIHVANWIIIITLAFEIIYIAWQASRGQASHYNQSSPFYAFMFSMMAIAATIATLAVGYIGSQFFMRPFDNLPEYYLWAIRFGFTLFVIFSFQGFAMGARMAHTVGAEDGVKGLTFLNWSIHHGDLRIAHFIGMHALQVLPLIAWYVLKSTRLTIVSGLLYLLLACFTLVTALRGSPLLKL